MSKHEKHVRRERKKTDRARRLGARFRHPLSSPLCGSHIKHGAAALAAAAVIAAGTQAYATPVRFENPPGAGHFNWTRAPGEDVLNVLQDAASQPGAAGAVASFDLDSYYGTVIKGGTTSTQLQGSFVGGYGFVIGVASGDSIPTASPLFDDGRWYVYSNYPYAPLASLLPENDQTYLAIRFDQGGGYQYGWIGVVRTGMELDAFAWGYETEVGVPIPAGVPEPGSLALLAFGAAAALRKRRPA